MRLDHPRIPPLPEAEWSQAQHAELAQSKERGTVINVVRTLLRRPPAATAFRPWAGYVMFGNSLPPRQREIVILRTGFLCRSGYEWGQHVEFGLQAGLTPEEVERIKAGADAPGWSESDRVLLRMADELHADHFVSDATWADLSRLFGQDQCMDAVFAASQYTSVAMILNTFGVQLDEGMTLDPDLDFVGSRPTSV
jgi:alkylhydroperoxidase family enzyme